MRTHFRALADLLVVILIKITQARIYDISHFATKVHVFIMVELAAVSLSSYMFVTFNCAIQVTKEKIRPFV